MRMSLVVDSIEVPATEMVLDLKQIVSIHIVELDTHTLDTAVERVEKSIFPRSLDQNASSPSAKSADSHPRHGIVV